MIPLRIGIDLGTTSILLNVSGQGIVVNEPSVVALDHNAGKVLAVGSQALEMVGRTPAHIVAVRPMREGVVANLAVTEAMCRFFLRRVSSWRRVLATVCVPSGVSSVERRAATEAVLAAGATKCWTVEEPLAAAIGAGVDIKSCSGVMVVDAGGGTTDAAVICCGQVVASASTTWAGDAMDAAIQRMLRREHGLIASAQVAESLKINLGAAVEECEAGDMEIHGSDVVDGLPRGQVVSCRALSAALKEPLDGILTCIKGVIQKIQPELAGDLADNGIILTGGGALLNGLDRLIAKVVGVPVKIAEEPLTCVARGVGQIDTRLLEDNC